MSAACLSTAYLASVHYYSKLAAFDEIHLEAAEYYPKQTFRNRCRIATSNGIHLLTVPVEKSATPKAPIRDIRISDHGNWHHIHWNALVSAYRMSPFFEYYADDFHPFYEQKYTFLIDYNEALQTMICNLLDLHPQTTRTTAYDPIVPNDFRRITDAKHPLPDNTFTFRPYYQVFRDRHGFLPNLSIVDLLFNQGPTSILLLLP
jgi:hypothetical protein